MSLIFFNILDVAIGALEIGCDLIGWTTPGELKTIDLNHEYFPGDDGLDPIGLCPLTPQEFLELQNKKIQNGCLAMLGAAGIITQELVNSKKICQFGSHCFEPPLFLCRSEDLVDYSA